MGYKLSFQADRYHKGPHQDGQIRRWQPRTYRMISPDANKVWEFLNLSPQTMIMPRHHGRSEQYDLILRDPAAAGREHSQEWKKDWERWRVEWAGMGVDYPLEQFAFLGVNEFPIWIHGAQPLVTYTLAYFQDLETWGARGVGGSINVGHPQNTGTGTPVNWAPYDPIFQYMLRHMQHLWDLHEYHGIKGPEITQDGQVDWGGVGNWGWLCGRYKQLPYQVPLVIGEYGFERKIDDDSVEGFQRGWKAWISAEQYVDWLLEYEAEIQKDPRIISAEIFLYDGQGDWNGLRIDNEVTDILLDRLGTNDEHGWYPDIVLNPPTTPPTVPPVEPPTELADIIRQAGRDAQVIPVNPQAAFIDEADFLSVSPVSPEVDIEVDGHQIRLQRCEDLNTGQGYTLWAYVGKWDDIRHIRD